MDSSVSTKDEIWFLRVCHHVSNALYTCVASRSVPRLYGMYLALFVKQAVQIFAGFQFLIAVLILMKMTIF
jgi:hypothetical protein